MATLDFPNSPTMNQTATLPNGFTYQWDGQVWKLAGGTGTGADWVVAGSAITPADATKTVALAPADALQWGVGTIKGRLVTNADQTEWTTNISSGSTVDNPARPQWLLVTDTFNDNFLIYRSPAGATPAWANIFMLSGAGKLAISGWLTFGTRGGVVSTTTYTDFAANDSSSAATYTPTNPSYILRIDTSVDQVQIFRRPANAGAGSYSVISNWFNAGDFQIVGANAYKSAGTTWANPSDPRLKDDIAPYTRGLTDLLHLEPITYRLKAQPEGLCYGFDASKVRDVFPECVSETRMKLSPEDEEETDGVLSFDMHPVLVAMVNGLKELATRVAALESK